MVGGIENVGLAKRLPLGTALRMTLQGRNFRLSAERAYALGLVDELVSPEALLPTARKIAGDIAQNSPHAVSLSQQAVWSALEMPYSQAVEYSYGLVKDQWQHPDFVEGPRAFVERRPPQWQP
jgi:enoyl-CoA hydratase/carnithine racemase